ncbi:hypothetical protein ZHAS_00021120 [Anopheles sinensis]|uniref:Uncharacterized protein n=1 Tax=Anopheles sinensis TaxID=74873 RepID=A0A084WRK4_ANOSI|nr:hypothetical protein ZHAS_00021120 [Anopheles sinensis]
MWKRNNAVQCRANPHVNNLRSIPPLGTADLSTEDMTRHFRHPAVRFPLRSNSPGALDGD